MASTIQVRVDDDLKAKSDELFRELGTDTTTAIRMFLTLAISAKGFPFEKIDGRTASAGSVIVPLGVVENVQELHAFLYAKENYIVSDTVKTIAGAVEQSTGYTRADYTP